MSTEKNTNVLIGFECPECGSLGPFQIAAKSWFQVSDSGTDSHSDVEWEKDSAVICCGCNHEGTVKSFERPGMKCPACGCRRFNAKRTVHTDIIVDEDGDFVEDCPEGQHPAEVTDVSKPYGPYTCVNCGEEFDDLTPEEREASNNDAETAT